MSVFGSPPAPGSSVEVRVAWLESALTALLGTVTTNASAAASATALVSQQRAQGDTVSANSIAAEINARVLAVANVLTQLGAEVQARVAGDQINFDQVNLLAQKLAQALGESLALAGWVQLEAISTTTVTPGKAAKVYGPDAGTHVDPVLGGAPVPNTGVYSAVPGVGWKRIANLEMADIAAAIAAATALLVEAEETFTEGLAAALVDLGAAKIGAIEQIADAEGLGEIYHIPDVIPSTGRVCVTLTGVNNTVFGSFGDCANASRVSRRAGNFAIVMGREQTLEQWIGYQFTWGGVPFLTSLAEYRPGKLIPYSNGAFTKDPGGTAIGLPFTNVGDTIVGNIGAVSTDVNRMAMVIFYAEDSYAMTSVSAINNVTGAPVIPNLMPNATQLVAAGGLAAGDVGTGAGQIDPLAYVQGTNINDINVANRTRYVEQPIYYADDGVGRSLTIRIKVWPIKGKSPGAATPSRTYFGGIVYGTPTMLHTDPGCSLFRSRFISAENGGSTSEIFTADARVAAGFSRAMTHRARAGNVATLTIGAHPLVIGNPVAVTGAGGTGYNTTNVKLTGVAGTTISFPSVGPNEGTTADAGGTVKSAIELLGAGHTGESVDAGTLKLLIDGVEKTPRNVVTHRERSGNVAKIYVPAGHTHFVNEPVTLTGSAGAAYNAEGKVLSEVGTDYVRFPSVGSDEAKTADATGIIHSEHVLLGGTSQLRYNSTFTHPIDGVFGTSQVRITLDRHKLTHWCRFTSTVALETGRQFYVNLATVTQGDRTILGPRYPGDKRWRQINSMVSRVFNLGNNSENWFGQEFEGVIVWGAETGHLTVILVDSPYLWNGGLVSKGGTSVMLVQDRLGGTTAKWYIRLNDIQGAGMPAGTVLECSYTRYDAILPPNFASAMLWA
ncbi:hypothetical protein P1X14_16645 [Sphingomonas sp. AOB5]|uniref:hypothetical protein n=1 Tax=Sphingomonas sp. AOB5 TaxID=3034017 RepID=UPI0023F6AD9B|nr:hypothetical protein [Sphingomonas sp. AOB5]MDF7776888.1 hypothetical protein [Sphingomonas sp. AOB5]